MTKASRQKLHTVSREFFTASLTTYLLMVLAEALKSGYVTNFFNINALLLVVLVTGVGMVLSDVDRQMLRSAQRLFTYPTEEISRLVAVSKHAPPSSAVNTPYRRTLRATGRVMDFGLRRINRLPQRRTRPRPAVPSRNVSKQSGGVMDIIKK
jgi:hypothetical protein